MLDGEREHGVQEHVVPALEAVLDPRLVLAAPADALHDVGDVHHRPEDLAVEDDVGGRDLARQAEVLLVPDEVVVEEELGRELGEQRRVRVEHELAQAVGRRLPEHPLGELVAVGPRLREVQDAVREDVAPAVAAGDQLVHAPGPDLAPAELALDAHRAGSAA